MSIIFIISITCTTRVRQPLGHLGGVPRGHGRRRPPRFRRARPQPPPPPQPGLYEAGGPTVYVRVHAAGGAHCIFESTIGRHCRLGYTGYAVDCISESTVYPSLQYIPVCSVLESTVYPSLQYIRVYNISESTIYPSLQYIRVYSISESTVYPCLQYIRVYSLQYIRVYSISEFTVYQSCRRRPPCPIRVDYPSRLSESTIRVQCPWRVSESSTPPSESTIRAYPCRPPPSARTRSHTAGRPETLGAGDGARGTTPPSPIPRRPRSCILAAVCLSAPSTARLLPPPPSLQRPARAPGRPVRLSVRTSAGARAASLQAHARFSRETPVAMYGLWPARETAVAGHSHTSRPRPGPRRGPCTCTRRRSVRRGTSRSRRQGAEGGAQRGGGGWVGGRRWWSRRRG
jgi:hypothetical protein